MTMGLPTPAHVLAIALNKATDAQDEHDLIQGRLLLDIARELREGGSSESEDPEVSPEQVHRFREDVDKAMAAPAPSWASSDRFQLPISYQAGEDGPADPRKTQVMRASCGIEGHPSPLHHCESRGDVVSYDATSYGDQALDQTVILHVEQPMPAPGEGPSIQSMVRADLEYREQVGIQRYGTPLHAHNGRDALRDAYEESLDLACYLRQMMEERQ